MASINTYTKCNLEHKKRKLYNGKIKNIEALRFIFAVIIVYFYILHRNLLEMYEGFTQLSQLNELCQDGCFIVELFFIISGFFLFKTFEKYRNTTVFQFALNKVFRLWSVFAFSILCCFIMHILGLIK